MDERDTLGGIIEIIALYLPPGLGSHVHWDRKLEARIGGCVLGVQAVKGVEFGTAFENTRKPGTQIHDPIILGESVIIKRSGPIEDNSANGPSNHPKGGSTPLVRPTNRAGGLEGGITTGQPLIVRAAMKPIATTLTPQRTVNLVDGVETLTEYERSDFCPVPRAVPIIEAVTAYVLADALIEKLGGDSLEEMKPRFETLRRAQLGDLPLVDEAHTFWS